MTLFTVDADTFPDASDNKTLFCVKSVVVIVDAAPVMAFCLLLNVVQSELPRYPSCVALAFFTCIVVPDPITDPVPPVTVRTDDVDSVKLPFVTGGS